VVGFTRALRAETRGTGVRTTIVMPGIVRTQMIGGFLSVRGTKTLEPSDVGKAIVAALRGGRPEMVLPRELGPLLDSRRACLPEARTVSSDCCAPTR
jgi:short-subunit dehydrogenase